MATDGEMKGVLGNIMPNSNKQRQAVFKERMRSGGFVQITVWVHEDDKARAIKYLKRLTDRRK